MTDKLSLFKKALALQATYGDWDSKKKEAPEDPPLINQWKKLAGLSRKHSIQLLKSDSVKHSGLGSQVAS